MYQFAHVEAYARQPRSGRNIRDIAAEAERQPDYCSHVPSPRPPGIVYGCTPSEAVESAERWAAQHKDTLGRGLRKDGMCLLAGVISYPADGDNWEEFKNDAVEWLKEEYGECLESVIEHTDEEHPHIHFYAVPKPGQHFNALHVGRAESEKVKKEGGSKKQQQLAFSEAMRKWQDRIYQDISKKHGLARLGPKRQRLTRDEWKLQKQAVALLAASSKAHYSLTDEDFAKVDELFESAGKKPTFGKEKVYTESEVKKLAGRIGAMARNGQSKLQADTLQSAKDAMAEKDKYETEIERLKSEIEKLENDFNRNRNSMSDQLKKAWSEYERAKAKSELLENKNNALADQCNALEEQLRNLKHEYR